MIICFAFIPLIYRVNVGLFKILSQFTDSEHIFILCSCWTCWIVPGFPRCESLTQLSILNLNQNRSHQESPVRAHHLAQSERKRLRSWHECHPTPAGDACWCNCVCMKNAAALCAPDFQAPQMLRSIASLSDGWIVRRNLLGKIFGMSQEVERVSDDATAPLSWLISCF